jgi:tripartite-type tricarboxylate transporter receptor subunit TctC
MMVDCRSSEEHDRAVHRRDAMKMQGLAVVGSLLLAAIPAAAQDAAKYPQKPIKIIVNVTPGGGIDSATRIVAQKVGERFGEPFVIENRAGGAGNIAAEAVYHSEPDGYTLLASPGATISMNDFLFKKLNYDPTKFEPVSVLTSVPLALIVRPDFPAKDFNEFVAYAKANPGKINYASNGLGAAGHLTSELFMLTTGTKMTHIAYKGTGPVLNDLIAGHVDATFIQYSAFYDLHKAGRARILAVADTRRVAPLPDIPTMAEMGYPAVVSNTWNMLSAPPKTPQAILAKLNRTINEVLAENDIKARFAEMKTTIEGGSLEDAKRYVVSDRDRWTKVIVSAGVQAE